MIRLMNFDKIYDFLYSENIKWYTLSYTEKEMKSMSDFLKDIIKETVMNMQH